eukprot:SAG31_NODE_3857_length_3815_cov_2.961518_2_plen_57_part_00
MERVHSPTHVWHMGKAVSGHWSERIIQVQFIGISDSEIFVYGILYLSIPGQFMLLN